MKYKITNLFSVNLLKHIIIISIIIGPTLTAHAAKVSDFMPQDSIVYIQLKDADEVYKEIQISDIWKSTLEMHFDESDLQEMRQALLFGQQIMNTDLSELVDMFGFQTGVSMWDLDEDGFKVGLVIHSGGNLSELQRITKIFTGLIGMNEGTLNLDAGKYRNVKYDTLELPEVLLTYGFVADCLVVGIGDNSFEKLIDTYKKKFPSIRKNESYIAALKECGEGQLSVYAKVRNVVPYIDNMTEEEQKQLHTFDTFFARLNLLDVAPILHIYTEFNPDQPESRITPFLKEGTELQSLKHVTGDEDLFIAVAPTIMDSLWQLLQIELEDNADEGTYAFITFLEGILNLDLNEDLIKGLTGEMALSVDDLMHFDLNELESMDIQFENSLQIDASNVNTEGALIFVPNNKQKWEKISNSFSNLQNTSVLQSEYKGADISKFSSNIYFAERDNISILSFSEDQLYKIVDRFEEKKNASYIKQLPKSPIAVVKLDIKSLFKIIDERIRIEEAIVRSEELSPILAWVTVKDNKASLSISISDKEYPLETVTKFAPIIAFQLKR